MQSAGLIGTISKTFVPVHRAGYPFIAGFFVAALILGSFWKPLFWIGLMATAWCAYFFRDPERVTPVSDDLVISPADGRISHITESIPPAELKLGEEPMQRVSIFMNVFNCHINRAPATGPIIRIVHTPGKFLNAELDKASTENERNGMVIDGPRGALAVVQIAGLVARRIVCFARQGEEISTGERFGLIRFGSRLDVYLPAGAAIAVAAGQTAIAGETIIARYGSEPINPIIRVG